MRRTILTVALTLLVLSGMFSRTLAEPPAPGTGAAAAVSQPPRRLAVLMYHEVDDTFQSAFTVTRAQLEAQIKMLKEEGYHFYSLTDLEHLLAGDPRLPEKGVMLTFDDGYQSFATEVLPLARKYNVPAVSFIVAMYADRDIIIGRPHMSNAEMKAVTESGLLELAGHSYDAHRLGVTEEGFKAPVLTHRIWHHLAPAAESKAEFAERVRTDFVKTAEVLMRFGVDKGVRHYAFPFTSRTDEAVALGKSAGFEYFYIGGEKLVTPETDPTAIPRVHAGAPEITAERLKARLEELFFQP